MIEWKINQLLFADDTALEAHLKEQLSWKNLDECVGGICD